MATAVVSRHTCFLSKEFNNTYHEGGRQADRHMHQPTHSMTSRPRVKKRRQRHSSAPSVSLIPVSSSLCGHLRPERDPGGKYILHTSRPLHSSQLLVWCSKKQQWIPTLQAKLAVLASKVGPSKETLKGNSDFTWLLPPIHTHKSSHLVSRDRYITHSKSRLNKEYLPKERTGHLLPQVVYKKKGW